MKTDIIVINYNTLKWFENCIKKITYYTYPNEYRLILIDNGSDEVGLKDAFGKIIKNYLSPLKVKYDIIRIHQNIGYGQAINKGVKKSTSDFFIVISADVEICRNYWLPDLLKVMKEEKKCGIVAPKYYLNKEKTILGGTGFYIENGKLWIRGWMEEDNGQYNKREEMASLCGAMMLIRRKIFNKVKGFSPEFYLYFEETDLIFKIRQEGYKAIYEPDVEVIHYWNKTPDVNKEKYYAESQKIFYDKWDKTLK